MSHKTQEIAVDRYADAATELCDQGALRNLSPRVLFAAFAGIVAGQNPRLARKSVGLLELWLKQQPVAEPIVTAGHALPVSMMDEFRPVEDDERPHTS